MSANLKLRATALAAEDCMEESRLAWLAAAQQEIAQLTVEPSPSGYYEALFCILSARNPLLSTREVRNRIARIRK